MARTMQDKLTDMFHQKLNNVFGTSRTELIASPASPTEGTWYVQEGTATSVTISYRFEPTWAKFEFSGDAVDALRPEPRGYLVDYGRQIEVEQVLNAFGKILSEVRRVKRAARTARVRSLAG